MVKFGKFDDDPEAKAARDRLEAANKAYRQGKPRGDCYEVHARYILDVDRGRIPDPPRDLRLCQGQVWNGDRWIDHAWLEFTQEIPAPPGWTGPLPRGIAAVMDISQGQRLTAPAVLWYVSSRARNVHRYTAVEAALLMLRTGHFGPWE